MTSKEVLIELINLGIVHSIGDEYFITHRVNEAFEKIPEDNTINLTAPIIPINELYPKTIREASIDKKVKAILDYCEVPNMITRNGTRFMVRSYDSLTKNSILKIIKNPEYKPTILLESIKEYYAYMEYPKAFKNFVKDGDIFSMYNYYENGNKLDRPDKPTNEICL